jgi:hypothetical protein
MPSSRKLFHHKGYLMLAHSFNPQTETTALYDAITLFRTHWEQRRTMHAVFDLCDAIDRAEDVSMAFR